MPNSYLSPAVEVRSVFGDQYGIFAVRPIKQDDIIAVWGGVVYSKESFMALPAELRERSLQIESEYFLVPHQIEDADFVNHSCNPNAGLRGQTTLVAMRDIAIGEQINFDYAMTDSTDYDEFQCQCGSEQCRGYITGDDWRNPVLQERYRGYFSAYLQRMIDVLLAETLQEVKVPANKQTPS
jgi:hypothetical protein